VKPQQPSFTQIPQPAKSSQKSIDLSTPADLHNLRVDPSFIEKLMTKKQNASVDLSQRNNSHLLAALRTAREGMTASMVVQGEQ